MITKPQAEQIAELLNEQENDPTFASVERDADSPEEQDEYVVIVPVANFNTIRIAEQIVGSEVTLSAGDNKMVIIY